MNLFGVMASHMLATKMVISDFEERAFTKITKARTLPRKQKKSLMRDALLDYSISQFARDKVITW